ncbi:uncharacterized protein LOC127386532 [Apus apus]|uniref:uncharacterized protein LOC127386532 n=1 Tax=Apus apus TaxID=8895 RepID=UPI0021F91EBF|nr:uncharacterized protein LOC127386532 [Apus apus]
MLHFRSTKSTRFCGEDKMLVDPLVLKKKLNRMATEQGAFAVLSSLLLYVTELAAGDPQLSSKRTKWAEGKENKVSYNQPRPDKSRGQHPTRFQLLRARFLNNNREPYTKKRREVGKLVIKEKLWMSRAGNKLDRSRDRKGDGKAGEEDTNTRTSERARWSSMTGKNTVKNILKKFLAAEEKEAKENSPGWKKKGPNSGLPKIVNRSSVLSKLKEQFEQSALCSATEVRASLLPKGEKKTKNFPSRKTIRKPEVRVLRTTAMTATGINSPESQYLVCSTVPVPRLSIATKINHPWSWSKNSAVKQPFGQDTPLKEDLGSNRELGENTTPASAAQDRVKKEEFLVEPKAMFDAKDSAEAKIDSTKQGPDLNPDLDTSSTSCKTQAVADCLPPLSEHSLDCDRNSMLAGPDTSSVLGATNAVQHVKEASPSSSSPYSSTAGGSHEKSPQDANAGEIPEITMYVHSSEEDDTELMQPEKNPFFTGQKCSPELKALESILPFHSPGIQTSCEIEPPMQDRQITLLTPASAKRPPIVQKEAPGLRGRFSEEAKEGAKHHTEDKISSTSSKNYSDVPDEKEEENKTPDSWMQNESKTKQPEPPQMPSLETNFGNYHADTPNPDINQSKHTLSSNESQEQKPGAAEEENVSSSLEKTQNPLTGDLMKHSFYTAEEDLGKGKLSSSNEILTHANNQVLDRSTLTDLETCHNQSKSFIKHEEGTADEMSWPDSEAWQSHLSNPLPTQVSGIAGQRIHHTLGNPPSLLPVDLVRQGTGGVEEEHASHGCENHPLPSSEDLTDSGNNTMVEKKTERDFKNQILSPNDTTENENSAAEETNTCQNFENCLSLSTKKPGKQENKTMLARKPLLPLEKNQTPTSGDAMKQGSDMLKENPFPSSTESVLDQKKRGKGSSEASKHKKGMLLSSGDDMKHENDKMETEEKEERNVLHKSEEAKVSTPSGMMDHDNSSNEKNARRLQTSQLPSSEHDTNIKGVESTDLSLKCLTPSKDFVKDEHDLSVDENICGNNREHHLSSSDKPMKLENSRTEQRNIKSNFKNYLSPTKNITRQDNKTSDEENMLPNWKKDPVQHRKSREGEGNTLCDPKSQIPSLNPLVKQDKKSSPLETQKQTCSGDFVKPEMKPDEKKNKHISEKPHSRSLKKVLKPQEINSSGERKQKTPAEEDIRSPETKSVKETDKHHHSGNHQSNSKSHPLSKAAKPEKNVPGGEKQQSVPGSLTKPDAKTVEDKNKDLGSGMYQLQPSNSLVKPKQKNMMAKKKQSTPPADEKATYKTGSPEKKSGPERKEKYQLRSSAQTEKHGNDGSGKEDPVDSYQTPLQSDGIKCKSSTVPKASSSSNTEKSPKSSPVLDASKYEENPMEDRRKQPGLKKYQAVSSKNLVKHEKDVAEREGSWQAAGKTSGRKAELEDCSKAASFPKYTAESYSEGPLETSFKPLIIRITDTFKHHS